MGSNGFYEINTVLNLCSGTQFVKITRDADGYYFIEENPSDCGGGSTGGGGWWPFPW